MSEQIEESSLLKFKQWIKGAVFMLVKRMSVTVNIVSFAETLEELQCV